MSTSASPLAAAVGTAVGAAVAAPVTGASAIITALGEIAKPLIDLIPDPQKKLEAQQHVADQQFQLAMAQIDEQNKAMTAASANVTSDTHMPRQRAYFCGGITTMLIMNYTGLTGFITGLVNKCMGTNLPAQFAIPANVLAIFAVVMLGFVGIPSALQMVQAVAGMPGESQVSVLGVSVKNKSNG